MVLLGVRSARGGREHTQLSSIFGKMLSVIRLPHRPAMSTFDTGIVCSRADHGPIPDFGLPDWRHCPASLTLGPSPGGDVSCSLLPPGRAGDEGNLSVHCGVALLRASLVVVVLQSSGGVVAELHRQSGRTEGARADVPAHQSPWQSLPRPVSGLARPDASPSHLLRYLAARGPAGPPPAVAP